MLELVLFLFTKETSVDTKFDLHHLGFSVVELTQELIQCYRGSQAQWNWLKLIKLLVSF